MNEGRRPFEPKGQFDRVVYAVNAVGLPFTVIAFVLNGEVPYGEVPFFTFFLILLWGISAFYTLEWAFKTYRRSGFPLL